MIGLAPIARDTYALPTPAHARAADRAAHRLAIELGVERLLQQIFAQHELAQDLFDDGRILLPFSRDICKAKLIVEFLDGHVLMPTWATICPAGAAL